MGWVTEGFLKWKWVGGGLTQQALSWKLGAFPPSLPLTSSYSDHHPARGLSHALPVAEIKPERRACDSAPSGGPQDRPGQGCACPGRRAPESRGKALTQDCKDSAIHHPRPAPRLSAAAAPDCPGPHPGPSTYTTIQDPGRASKGRADIINRGECFQVVTKGGQDRNLCTHGGGASEGRQLWPCLWGSCTLCGPSAGLVGAQGPTLSRTEPVTLPLSISLRTSLRRFPDQPELCHVLSIQNPHRYRSRFTRCGTKYN